ncbi:MAG: hypothetical protein AMK69_13845 [Nitrospira bacterium SG8_3]|nr:MAG: hypothetical protein AMK69_13845 [Nitrospira bacterium SG8_3]
MKRNLKKDIAALLVATFAIATCGLMPAHGDETRPSADFSVSALSAYIWRGQELSRDSIVVQPSMTVSYGGFSANLWANLDTEPYTSSDEEDDSSNWNETDLTLSYGRQFGPVGAELGYIYYALDGLDDSQEFFLSLGLDTLLAPTLTVYKEFDHYPHWYILFGISHAFEMTDTVSLELSGSASYLASDDEDAYPEINTGDEFSDFHDGTIAATLPISVSEYVTVTPTIAYTFALSGDGSDQMEWFSQKGDDDGFVYGGVTLSFAF